VKFNVRKFNALITNVHEVDDQEYRCSTCRNFQTKSRAIQK